MNDKKIVIITASIVIPLVFFGVFIGTADFLKGDIQEEINPQNLRVVSQGGINPHHPQYPPFEYGVYNSHVTVLATVESVETMIVDESTYQERHVNKEGYSELEKELSLKLLAKKITNEEYLEILRQQQTGETYEVYMENKKPYRFITLSVDQYLKDETEKFADVLVIKTPGNGEGVRNGEKVYFSHTLGYPIGEQAIYILINYFILAEKGIVAGDEYDDKYTIIAKYDINDDNTIQSMYSQKVLESLYRYEQNAAIITINYPEEHAKKMKWTLPIPLDEAIIRAQEQAKTDHLIINYSSSYLEDFEGNLD